MAFPPSFLDDLRSRIQLSSMIRRSVKLTRHGREYTGLCPFHSEKTASFYVVEDKAFYHCFGCGAHGDAIGFVMRRDNLEFVEAVHKLAAEAGLAIPTETPHQRERREHEKTALGALAAAAEFYQQQLQGSPGLEWLRRRGISDEAIGRFRLGWAPPRLSALRDHLQDFSDELLLETGLINRNLPPEDFFRGRVIYPIIDRQGRVVAFGGRTLQDEIKPKYLNSPDTPVFTKGKAVYLAAGISPAPPIIVEGYMDVISLWQFGFPSAVASLGTALTEDQLRIVWRLGGAPVLCFDGDAAGLAAAQRVLRRALPVLQPNRSLSFTRLPAGEDPDSLVHSQGAAALQSILDTALPLSEMLWQTVTAAGADGPEGRVRVHDRISSTVAEIADQTIQEEYRAFLLNRLAELQLFAYPDGGNIGDQPTMDDAVLGLIFRYPALADDAEIKMWLATRTLTGERARLRDAIVAGEDWQAKRYNGLATFTEGLLIPAAMPLGLLPELTTAKEDAIQCCVTHAKATQS